MMFQKKIDRAMNWLKEKNNSETNDYDSKVDGSAQEDHVELEKEDILAIILSAILVFGPILLILIVILVLVFKI